MAVIVDVDMVIKVQVQGWVLGMPVLGAEGKTFPLFIEITTTGEVEHLYGPVLWQVSPVLPLDATVVF